MHNFIRKNAFVLASLSLRSIRPYVHNSSNQSIQNSHTLLQGVTDRYKGVWIDMENQKAEHFTEKEFNSLLSESLQVWRSEKLACVWLKVPMSLGHVISVAWSHGFIYHHAEGSLAVLNLWIDPDKENKVPMFATHQVGVSGIVLNEDTKEVLCVKDKNKWYSHMWKFPGGLADLGEDIKDTAEREVFEETGVRAEFQSILAFRQQHTQPGAFGRSDLFYLCRLKPLTFDLDPCEEEIAECQWMGISQLCEAINKSSITHMGVQLVLRGLEQGFHQVDIKSHTHKSIYKGLKYQLFHRPL